LVPLAALAFAPHMIQHELLMLVAAPLLVIGNPFVAFAWALPEAWRPAAVQGWRRGGLERASVTLTRPIVAFLVHGAVLWAWHAPALFNGAMANALVHAGQHLTFTGTAVLFWWGLLHGRYGRLAHGAGVVFVFLTAVHSSLLGALLTLAPTAWYRPYVVRMNGSAADALSDQQLAGLLMWIPSAVFFIAAGLLLTSLWIRAAGTRSVSRPAAN
jgi:putative membrane protein